MNAIGQRTNVEQTGTAFASSRDIAWTYDALGQVIGADNSIPVHDRAYQYDTIGNRKKSADSLTRPGSDNYVANALNQYSTVDSITPAYDDDGNATAYPVPAHLIVNSTLIWDAENRLISATVNSVTTTYQYDSQSRRIATTVGGATTISLYDGWNPIAEYQGSPSTPPALSKTYTWGTDLSGTLQGAGGVGGLLSVTDHDTTPAHHYPTYDGNGNVSEYLDETGAITAHYEYDPFGRTTVSTGPKANDFVHRFSTKPLDEATGLYYYGYRYYDPQTGRWPSRDPIGEYGGVNLYGFVGNDGLNWWDYLGLAVTMSGGGLSTDQPDCCRSPLGREVDKVSDEFGSECCPDEIKVIRVKFQNSKSKRQPGHMAIQTPNRFCGYYPRGGVSGVKDPKADGLVMDEMSHKPDRAWDGKMEWEACPDSVSKMDEWIEEQQDLFDENLTIQGHKNRNNPFGGKGGEAYNLLNQDGGRNCAGWVATGIDAIGGVPHMNPSAPMPVSGVGIQNPTR